MALKLAASGDDRALAIRHHLLPLVRARGALELQRGPVRLVVLRTGPWTVEHWTPLADLSPGEASSPGYRHAVERQRAGPDLPYGVEVRATGRWCSACSGPTTALRRSPPSCAAPGRTKHWRCDGRGGDAFPPEAP